MIRVEVVEKGEAKKERELDPWMTDRCTILVPERTLGEKTREPFDTRDQ